MKLSALLLAFLGVTGTLAIQTTPLWSKSLDPECRPALMQLMRAHNYLGAKLARFAALYNLEHQPDADLHRSTMINAAQQFLQQVKITFTGHSWGPHTSPEFKKQLSDAVEETLNVLEQANSGNCGEACDELAEMLLRARDLQTAKNVMFIRCKLEQQRAE